MYMYIIPCFLRKPRALHRIPRVKKNQRNLNLSETLFGRNPFFLKLYLNVGKKCAFEEIFFFVSVNGLKSEKATVTEIERGSTLEHGFKSCL